MDISKEMVLKFLSKECENLKVKLYLDVTQEEEDTAEIILIAGNQNGLDYYSENPIHNELIDNEYQSAKDIVNDSFKFELLEYEK